MFNLYSNMSNYGQSPLQGNGTLADMISGVTGGDALAKAASTAVASPTSGSLWDSLIGTTDQPGWGGMALGAAQGLGSAYMGMQQLALAKQTLAANQRQFDMNYAAQRQTTNTALEDRQRARVASNAGAYQSVGDYMNANRVV